MENKIKEFKEKWDKYSELRILKPIEDYDWEKYQEAWKELSIYRGNEQIAKDALSDQKNFTFSYYLEKPIKLDPYNKGFREEWKKEYPDRIDEQDNDANEELDNLIGKVDTLSKYGSRGRCKEWFEETPLTCSVNMKDRRVITFHFNDIEQGFEAYLHALGRKYQQILKKELETSILWKNSRTT
ncbi:MAG: hypothetical protein mread185_000250 [Mycoplasmataceae bacterium]|nr:MAG: hypothetical protein mread185_000250 [Mycoplasmataceae bacterium]